MGAFVRDPATGILNWSDTAVPYPAQAPERSALGEIGTGIKRGAVVELPSMFGGALKATGKEGDTLYDIGAGMQRNAALRGEEASNTLQPDKHNGFVNALAEGGAMLAPSVAGMAAAVPVAMAGAPAAAVLGAGALASGALFGGSQFQDTYETLKKLGHTDDAAFEGGLKTGGATALGEGIASVVQAKFALGLGRSLKGATLDSALQGMKNPEVLKPFLGNYAKTLGVEVGTEMGQSGAVSAIENSYGAKHDVYESMKDTIAPTFGLTTLLAPFGLHAGMRRAGQIRKDVEALVDTTGDPADRIAAANRIGTTLDSNPPPGMSETQWKREAQEWRMSALEAINSGAAVDTDGFLTSALSGRKDEFIAAAAERQADEARRTAQAAIQPDEAAVGAAQAEALAAEQAQNELAPPSVSVPTAAVPAVSLQQNAQQQADLRAAQLMEEEGGMVAPAPTAARPPAKAPAKAPATPPTAAPAAPAAPAAKPAAGTVEAQLDAATTPEALAALLRTVPSDALAAALARRPDLQPRVQQSVSTRAWEMLAEEIDTATPPTAAPAAATDTPTPPPVDGVRESAFRWLETHAAEQNLHRNTLSSVKAKVGQAIQGKSAPEQIAALRTLAGEQKNPDHATMIGALADRMEFTPPPGDANVQATPVVQGSKPESGNSQSNAAVLENGAGQRAPGNAAGQPAQEAKKETAAEVPVTKQAKAAAARKAKADPATGTVQAADVGLAPDATMQLLSSEANTIAEQTSLADQLVAAGRAPFTPSDNVQKGAPKKSTAVKHITAKEATDALSKLTEMNRQVAQNAWDRLRNAEAASTTVDKGQQEQFFEPKWEALPPEAQYVYATGKSTDGRELTPEQRFSAALSVVKRLAATKKAREVNSGVDSALKNVKAEAAREGLRARLEETIRKIEAAPRGEERAKLVKQAQDMDVELQNKAKEDDVGKTGSKAKVRSYEDIRAAYGVDLADKASPAPRTAADAARMALQTLPEQGQATFLMDLIGKMLDRSSAQQGKLGPVAKLAKQLSTLYPDAIGAMKVVYKDVVGPDGADGRPKVGNYNATTNTVTIYKGGESWHTIMHEVVHGLTVKAMAQGRADLKAKRDTVAARAYANLEALFTRLDEKWEFDNNYGMKSVEEFVAEAMSNSAFQRELKGLDGVADVKGGVYSTLSKAWEQLVGYLAKLLRLPTGKIDALDQAIRLSTALIDIQNSMTAEQQAAATASMKTKSFNALSSPSRTLTSISSTVGGLTRGADSFLTKLGNWSDASGKVRRTALYMASTKQIQRWVKGANFPKALHDTIDKWFAADESKTRVMKVITDIQYGHVQDVEAALAKTGKVQHYNEVMMRLAGEASGFNLDLGMDYAQNRARNPKLADTPQMKAHVDALHKEFKALQNGANTKVLADLILSGERVNRQMYIMQSATLLRSAMHAAVNSKAGAVDPAQAVLNKFEQRLDVLSEPPKGATNPDQRRYADAKTADLNAALEEAFAFIDQHFPGTDHYESIKAIEKFYRAAVNNPYMHLGRSGRFMVRFNVKDTSAATVAAINKILAGQGKAVFPFAPGKDSVFMRFDTVAQAQQVHDLLKEPAFANTYLKDGTLAAGAITDADAMDKAFAVSTAVDKLRKLMKGKYADMKIAGQTDPAKEAGYQAAMRMIDASLIELMESSSARKMGAGRENTLGYDLDYVRNFAKRGQAYISTIGNQYAAPEFAQANIAMKEVIAATERDTSAPMAMKVRATEVYEELSLRHDNSMSPVDSPIIDAMRTFGYHFYLSLSPAFILTNVLQPYHLTLPYLGGRYGFVKAAKVMGRSTDKALAVVRATVKGSLGQNGWRGVLDARLDLGTAKLSAGERAFIEELVASGVVDFTQAHEIGRMSEGEDRRASTAAKALGIASHYSEVLNRLTAGLAAYELAGERVRAGKMTEEERFKFAVEAVNRTQYNYTDHNTARALGRHGFAGKLTPLFMSFQQYAFQTMEHYIQMVNEGFINKQVDPEDRTAARKALAGTLLMTGGIAGVLGLPFAGVIVAVSNAFGDDDDNRGELREYLNATFGKDLGEIIARGGPRALGFDMSSRAGHADLIPGTRFLADRRAFEDKMKEGSQTMMGPALNAAIDITAGAGKFFDGDLAGATEAMLPMALKGIAKAGRMANTGAFENKSGNLLPMPVDGWDLTVQAFGFTPAKKAEQSEANFYHQSQQAMSKQTKALLKKEAIAAIERGDSDNMTEAMHAITMHNAENPESIISADDITSTLEARARGRAAAQASGTGIIDSNMQNMPRLGRYSWANTGVE